MPRTFDCEHCASYAHGSKTLHCCFHPFGGVEPKDCDLFEWEFPVDACHPRSNAQVPMLGREVRQDLDAPHVGVSFRVYGEVVKWDDRSMEMMIEWEDGRVWCDFSLGYLFCSNLYSEAGVKFSVSFV